MMKGVMGTGNQQEGKGDLRREKEGKDNVWMKDIWEEAAGMDKVQGREEGGKVKGEGGRKRRWVRLRSEAAGMDEVGRVEGGKGKGVWEGRGR